METQTQHFRSEAVQLSILEKNFSFLSWFYAYLVLPFDMEPQTQSNWCWAATSKSVSRFYSFFSPWTQCKIASAELGNTCCSTPVPSACNVPWYLDKALTRTNNFVSIQSGTIPWQSIKDQLENGLVIGARIGWSGGGGHFMTIHGVSRVGITQYVHIDDPIYGKSVLTYDQYATNYQGSGTWTHTYFTKKYYYYMWFKDLLVRPELLKPIPEIRPLINVYNRQKIKEDAPEPKFDIAHHAYTLGLNQLRESRSLPDAPQSLRMIEIQNEKPVALYEVGLDTNKPELMQMNVSEPYFTQLNETLGRLKKFAQEKKELGEIRFIKVPALNMEAFWLHYDGDSNGNDIITPVRRFANDTSVDWSKGYTEQEFLRLLQEQAEKVNTSDELLGA